MKLNIIGYIVHFLLYERLDYIHDKIKSKVLSEHLDRACTYAMLLQLFLRHFEFEVRRACLYKNFELLRGVTQTYFDGPPTLW